MKKVPNQWMPWSRLTINNGMAVKANHLLHIDKQAAYLGAAYKPIIPVSLMPGAYPLTSTSCANPSGTDANRNTCYIYIPPYTAWLQVYALVGGMGTIDWYSAEEAAGEQPMRFSVDESYRTSADLATAYWMVSDPIRSPEQNMNRLLDVYSSADKRNWHNLAIDIYIQDDAGGSKCYLYSYFFVPLPLGGSSDMEDYST